MTPRSPSLAAMWRGVRPRLSLWFMSKFSSLKFSRNVIRAHSCILLSRRRRHRFIKESNSFSYSVSKDSQKWGIGISEPLQTEFLQIFEICEGAGETWETVHVEIEFT